MRKEANQHSNSEMVVAARGSIRRLLHCTSQCPSFNCLLRWRVIRHWRQIDGNGAMGISFAASRVGERKIDLRVVFAIAVLLAPAFRPRFVYQVGGEGALVASQIYLCIATVLACAYLVASSRKLPFSIWALVALVAIVFLSTAAFGLMRGCLAF